MKRILRPLFLRLARSLGVLDMHTRMDDLARRVDVYEIGGASLDQLASRKAAEAAEASTQKLLDIAAEVAAKSTQKLWESVVERDDAIQEAVMTASRGHTEAVVNEMRAYFDNEVTKIRRNVDRSRITSDSTSPVVRPSGASPSVPSSSPIDESLYVALEDRFRGDPETIRQRQSQYIPYIKDIVTTGKPLLDLGCGRGEWLTVLRDSGIPATGIDSNRACIDDCNQLGLNVELADLVEHLNAIPEKSVGAITMFQVMEHLPFPVLLNVLRAALRALTPGGVFIAEVPNSETLSVGASTFWIDPTHEKPLFPGLLIFLAKEIGFNKAEGVYSSPLKPDPDVTSLPSDLQETFLSMFRQLNGPGDFALIATA
jgi:2-polyprenyl-3-methyl-5-hydroxy-6-metoxy-1,4-benzoquinol methylase